MPTTLTLSNPDQLEALLSAAEVCDPSVGPVVADVTLAGGQTFAGDMLSVNVHGALGIWVFNSIDDNDDDGIFGTPPPSSPVTGLPPQLALKRGKALLKYRASAGIRARTSGETLQGLGFDLEAGLDVLLADYHLHPCAATLREAVLGDIQALRTSLRLADVLALAPGEAVSQQVVGRLSADVEVSWADVFMGPVAPLARLAGPAASVLIKVSAGASVRATVSLTDDFLLVFSKVDATRWRVGLRKARTRSGALGLEAGISVQLADPGHVTAVLDAAVEGVLGQPLAEVEAVIAKASLDRLSSVERRVAGLLVERLGLDPLTTTLDALGDRVRAIRTAAEEAVRAVATAKIALAFGYEYRRMRQDTTVAQCLVEEGALRRHHASLVRGHAGPLCADASDRDQGAQLEHFLYQKTIRSDRSWGFALSLGKWLSLGSTDTRSLTRVDRHSVEHTVQRSYLGSRGYRNEGDTRDRWSVDFATSMRGFSRGAVPLVSEFDSSLALDWFEPAKKLDETTLASWLDVASLWGVIADDELSRWQRQLAPALRQRCTFVAQLTFPHGAFGLMRPRVAMAHPSDLGPALGAAMPWLDMGGRRSPAIRRTLYGPLWTHYLSDDAHVHRRGRDFAPMARQHLQQHGVPDLAAMERLYEVTPTRPHDARLFCGLLDLNARTLQQCHDFLNGVRRLHADTVSAAPDHGAMQRVFEDMEHFWAQAHHVQALGVYLLDVARTAGVTAHVTRSAALTVGTGERADVYVIAQ